MNRNRQEKGITLIALVITIIVLLILAGVTISLTVGKNGALSKARNAVNSNEISSAKEELEIAAADAQMAFMEAWGTNQNIDSLSFYASTKEGENAYARNCTRADAIGVAKVTEGTGANEEKHVYIKYITKSQAVIYFDMLVTADDSFAISKGYPAKEIPTDADELAIYNKLTATTVNYGLAKGTDLVPDEVEPEAE